ncbi:AP-2 complex subunit sigma [Polytolypa hystricis UAMH7299]|uniref:AP-2 complex subunit sigma n=1 Tax=Polytolypa hystricis (strain UAMH7299) TaxID=1447883 RepID=A0A2B7XPY5_POLH7|nr:AP-2 complex subunit sigma [Polytolypa hystricis UAMH7299]
MVVYILYGFRWSRSPGYRVNGIRPHIVIHDILDAAAEYIQEPVTSRLILESFKKSDPDILTNLPDLQLIEQYDPEDTNPTAVSQPYAYIAAKAIQVGSVAPPGIGLGVSMDEILNEGPGLSPEGTQSLEKLKDNLVPDEKIGWFVVYNGDPERPVDDDEPVEADDEGAEVNAEQTETKELPLVPDAFLGEFWFGDGMVLSFILIQNRQGKTRLAKWYAPYTDDEKIKLKGEVHRLIAPRDQKYQSNFVEFRRSTKIVYRRYAGLFFCVCVDANDNELAYLEAIHFFVEVLDQFFGNVCELDLVFNFYKVYAILDEVFLAGEIEETSKQVVLTRLEHLDKLE